MVTFSNKNAELFMLRQVVSMVTAVL